MKKNINAILILFLGVNIFYFISNRIPSKKNSSSAFLFATGPLNSAFSLHELIFLTSTTGGPKTNLNNFIITNVLHTADYKKEENVAEKKMG